MKSKPKIVKRQKWNMCLGCGQAMYVKVPRLVDNFRLQLQHDAAWKHFDNRKFKIICTREDFGGNSYPHYRFPSVISLAKFSTTTNRAERHLVKQNWPKRLPRHEIKLGYPSWIVVI